MSTVSPTPAVSHDAGFAGSRGLQLVRGDGAHVFDAAGRRYLDATSMYGVTSLGHAHPAVAEALEQQSRRLVSCFASFGNDVRDGLLTRLAARLAPLDRFFLCNSGTESVEAAIKVARAFTGRPGVVALSGAFHGRTMGALSATFRSKHREAFAPLLEGFRHVRPGDLEGLSDALDDGVGMMLVEVVQGEGGAKPVDGDFLRAARALCAERGVLFAVDEIQTGIGRTGRWFGYEHHDLDPDLVCLAKGLGGGVPIGALAFRSTLGTVATGSHGTTFGGNPLAAAAACAVLDTIEREELVLQAERNGTRLLRLLEDLMASCCVREVRGLGLMIGIEFTEPAVPVQKRLQDRGYLVLGAGPRVLRLLPPLITPWEDLEALAYAIAEEARR